MAVLHGTVWSNISKTSARVSSGVPNTEKQMKARGRRPSAFIVSWWLLKRNKKNMHFFAIVLPKWKNNNLCNDAILPYHVTLLWHSWLIVLVWLVSDHYWKMLIKMQVFDLRSKPIRFSSECSLGIKVHACDPNMPHLLAVVFMNNQWLWEIKSICQFCFLFFQKNHDRQSWQEFCSRLYA